MHFPSSFISPRLVSIYMVNPYQRIDTTATWKKLGFILSDKSDFHMIANLSITAHAFSYFEGDNTLELFLPSSVYGVKCLGEIYE